MPPSTMIAPIAIAAVLELLRPVLPDDDVVVVVLVSVGVVLGVLVTGAWGSPGVSGLVPP